MTSEHIAAIYAELKGMSVIAPHTPQMGFSFYAERVAEARIIQDRLGDLIIMVNKDTARVRVATRTLKEIARLQGTTHDVRTADQLGSLANEADDLKYVAESLAIKAQLIRHSILDIRLVLTIMEAQIKLGEVAPVAKAAKPQVSGPDTSESAMMVERFLDSDARGTPTTHKH
jgi:hypothetical protein